MGDFDQNIDRTGAEALMPEEAAREIIQSAVQGSAALSLFRRVTMSRAQTRMPALAAFPAAYWVGGDTGLKKTTKQQWTNRYLNVAELAVLVPIPEAVLNDADYDIWGEVKPRLAEAFGEKLDAAIFFGDDVPSEWTGFNGIAAAAITAGNETAEGTNTLDNGVSDFGVDISVAMETVEDDGFDVTGHAGPRKLRAKLRNLRADTGEAIFQTIAGGAPPTIYAEPYAVIGNGAWDGHVLDVMGDYSQGILGMRQDISYLISREGVVSDDDGAVILNLLQQDSVLLRATMRCAFVVANPITRQSQTFADTDRYPFAVVTAAES